MTAGTPAAEVAVSESLVAALVRTQHPDFDGPLRLVANGWDNAVYRLGATWSVRLPRRAVAVPLLVNEQRWLPRLAPRLPVPVPVPAAVGEPAGSYPWPWSINPWLPGHPATTVPVPERVTFAADLAHTFAALHVPAPADAPPNAFRGVPLSDRTEPVRERLAGGGFPAGLAAAWEEALDAPPWTGPPVWLHADPHPANLLAGDDGRLAALIDFGDLTSGDPATDLAAAWMVFDAAGRAVFRETYATLAPLEDATDDATWRRARGWALSIGSAIAASSADNPAMAAIGAHALDQVLLPDGR
ncbi:aminoglycoside phosphotransferase family protein [Dactylosporangium sp. NPDC049742]|uniref:aminoglycoside phosphotransferase family protein n=1 Tax=Dactylosporangium sp. NPDC049742 TaxID=3154737 RepID=UPI003443F2D6